MRRPALALLLAMLLALGLAACGGDDEGTTAAEPAPQGQEQPPAESQPQAQTQPAQNGCDAVEVPPQKADGDLKKPDGGLKPDKQYELVFTTNCGRFTVELDPSRAPETSASLVSLARKDWYDGSVFSRIVPGFVIQGGDSLGGVGGDPGYETVDKPPKDAQYTKGVVAMAKTPQDPPGKAGSVFFIVTGEDSGLPADYAVVGEVSDGLEVVERIGQFGDAAEQPTQLVVIEDVAVNVR